MSGMTAAERWIYLDGPEPEPLASILDSVRDLGPATPEDVERHVRMVALALGLPETREDRGSDVGVPRESDVYVRSPRVEPEERDALPPPPPAPEPSPAAPIQADTRARPGNPLAATADTDLSALVRAALPFVPDSPGRVKAPRTLNSEVMRDPRLKETFRLGENLMSLVVPLTPFAGDTVGRGVVPFPKMDLERYALLRVELPELPPGKPREDFLTTYHVMNDASLRALVAHWTQRLAQDAEEKARYDALLAVFMHVAYEVRPRGL
jgi:hypothetical protein